MGLAPGVLHDLVRLGLKLLLAMAVFVPLERLFANRAQRVFRTAFLTDLAYYVIGSLVPKLLLILPLSLAAAALHQATPGAFYAAVAGIPMPVRLAAALVVGEVGYYWGHRWTHEIPLLWRFHAIHHSAEQMDWLVNTRAHPVDLVFTRFCGLVPLYALGLAQPMPGTLDLVPALFALVGSLWGFFVHANVRWRFGWLEQVVATPAFHHWHHTNDGPEVVDRNYAAMLPCVDRLFGTLHVPPQLPKAYGIDQPMPQGVAAQLLHPLRSPAATPPPEPGLSRS